MTFVAAATTGRTVLAKVMSSTAFAETATSTNRLAEILPPLADNSRRIYLLRHGETDWNRQGKMQGGGFDIELNDDGRHQARLAGELMSDLPLGIIGSSHLQRAVQTADTVSSYHPDAKRIAMPGFGEMRFGSLECVVFFVPDHQSTILLSNCCYFGESVEYFGLLKQHPSRLFRMLLVFWIGLKY